LSHNDNLVTVRGDCIPALHRLHHEFVSTQDVAIVSLSLDDDAVVWHGALKELKMPWPQGRITTNVNAGVSSVPAYWLLDPTGKILIKSNDIGEIRQRLNKVLK
jgi:hypothetical protein